MLQAGMDAEALLTSTTNSFDTRKGYIGLLDRHDSEKCEYSSAVGQYWWT